MIIRVYQPTDCQAALSIINAAAEVDRTRPLSAEALTLNPQANAVIAFTAEGAAAAFAWWWRRDDQDYFLEGWVHPAFRRRGYGGGLLTAAEVFVRRHGGGTLRARAYEDITGAKVLFERKGYTVERRFYAMRTALTPERVLEAELPKGISIRTFERGDLDLLVAADNEIFADHWGATQRDPETWERHMILSRPHNPRLWLIAFRDNEIVGECLCGASQYGNAQDGYISVVGVRRSWRGYGLGRALLTYGLRALRDHGFTTASLHVDSENHTAVNLYRSLEMDVVRTRLHFVKRVKP
ncbi:MAG: GNAT family N-acetyltransferase [Anaerolineae bacterium]|nr:GNAT family N-acetyltransferase [Anaerolineae bacterium]MDW8298219.1 GNAT family N-acetyltransferase [Anaerolineae bacterium]